MSNKKNIKSKGVKKVKAYIPNMLKLYRESVVPAMVTRFNYVNSMQVPKLLSVSLNMGLGDAKTNSKKLESAIYTPSSKAAAGEHDANISFAETASLVGTDLAKQIRDKSLELYGYATRHASNRGIIIADTKFEFGLDSNNELTLMDEVLTPDSSRFWSLSDYSPGKSPKSFDKQIIRDYLETLDWNKAPPAPLIPDEIMTKAASKYSEIQTILCN